MGAPENTQGITVIEWIKKHFWRYVDSLGILLVDYWADKPKRWVLGLQCVLTTLATSAFGGVVIHSVAVKEFSWVLFFSCVIIPVIIALVFYAFVCVVKRRSVFYEDTYQDDLVIEIIDKKILCLAKDILEVKETNHLKETLEIGENLHTNLFFDGKELLKKENRKILTMLIKTTRTLIENFVKEQYGKVVFLAEYKKKNRSRVYRFENTILSNYSYEANKTVAQGIPFIQNKKFRYVGSETPVTGQGCLIVVALMLDKGLKNYLKTINWQRRNGHVYCISLFVPAIFEGILLDRKIFNAKASEDDVTRESCQLLLGTYPHVDTFIPIIGSENMKNIARDLIQPRLNPKLHNL